MKDLVKVITLVAFTASSTAVFADTYGNTDSTATTPAATTTTTTSDSATPATPVDDSTLTTNVQNKITAEPALSGTSITVASNKGVIALTGNLDTDAQASKAVEVAESVDGVQDVDTSALTVKGSNQPVKDALITAKIKGTFLREKLFGNVDVPVVSITVETKNGVVFLMGTAATPQEVAKAIALAKTIKDVKRVRSKVQVKQS